MQHSVKLFIPHQRNPRQSTNRAHLPKNALFGIEIDSCGRCGGKLKVIASIEEPEVSQEGSHKGQAYRSGGPTYTRVRMQPRQYTVKLLDAYEEEVAGAVYFDGLAIAYPAQSAFFARCAAGERAMANQMTPLLKKYLLTPRPQAELEARGLH